MILKGFLERLQMGQVYRKFQCSLLCYFLIHYCEYVLDEANMKGSDIMFIDIIAATEKNVRAI
jgi:hypothetical protein